MEQLDLKFRTYEEILESLSEKGLQNTKDPHSLIILKKYGYYSIMHKYKNEFIDKNGNFYEGTNFYDIFRLYNTDRELREIFLNYILLVENIMKNKISYYNGKYFKTNSTSLNIKNFDGSLNEITNTISILSREIHKNLNSNDREIRKYIEKYGNLPFFVLVNKLSFGNLIILYSTLNQNVKEEICYELNYEYSLEYNTEIKFLNPSFLEKALEVILEYRNASAHENSIFDIKIHKNLIDYSLFSINKEFNGDLFDLLIILKIFLPKNEFSKLLNLTNNIVIASHNRLGEYSKIFLNKIGFLNTNISDINKIWELK